MSILGHIPVMNSERNPARAADEFEAQLARMSPWLACHMVADRHRQGRLERDDALVLLTMHYERAARTLIALETEIIGDVEWSDGSGS